MSLCFLELLEACTLFSIRENENAWPVEVWASPTFVSVWKNVNIKHPRTFGSLSVVAVQIVGRVGNILHCKNRSVWKQFSIFARFTACLTSKIVLPHWQVLKWSPHWQYFCLHLQQKGTWNKILSVNKTKRDWLIFWGFAAEHSLIKK